MTVPALSTLWSEEDVYAGHFRRYSVKSATNTLAASGLRVEYATYIFQPLVVPILLLRALPFRLGTRKSVDIETTEYEHALPDSLAGRFVKRGLQRELRRVRDGRKQWLGTSVAVVARKSSQLR